MRTVAKRKSGKKKMILDKFWTSLSDPKDVQTAWRLAFIILLAEAVLSLGIIYKVPCAIAVFLESLITYEKAKVNQLIYFNM